MNPATWKLESVWVARDEDGKVVRYSDVSPYELLRHAEELRIKANKGGETFEESSSNEHEI